MAPPSLVRVMWRMRPWVQDPPDGRKITNKCKNLLAPLICNFFFFISAFLFMFDMYMHYEYFLTQVS